MPANACKCLQVLSADLDERILSKDWLGIRVYHPDHPDYGRLKRLIAALIRSFTDPSDSAGQSDLRLSLLL